MLERQKEKRLVFVGNPLNRSMWELFVYILMNSIRDKRTCCWSFLILFVWFGATACNDPVSSNLELVQEPMTSCAQSNSCTEIFWIKMESSIPGSCLQVVEQNEAAVSKSEVDLSTLISRAELGCNAQLSESASAYWKESLELRLTSVGSGEFFQFH